MNLEEPIQDTSILEVSTVVPGKKKDQSPDKSTLEGQFNDQTPIRNDYGANDTFGDAIQEPPVIEVVSEKVAEETLNLEKDKDDGEKGVEGESAEVTDKEKGEEKEHQALEIVARDTSVVKGKQVVVDLNDFGKGMIDLSPLSPIEALKLATLAQTKANEDSLKSHFADKELTSLVEDMLDKIMPYFKQNKFDPSGKLKGLLSVVGSHFESLEKAVDIKVLNQFNAMRLKIFFKMIEDDRVTLVTIMNNIQDALYEGDRIYKSCLFFPKFTIDIEMKIRGREDQL